MARPLQKPPPKARVPMKHVFVPAVLLVVSVAACQVQSGDDGDSTSASELLSNVTLTCRSLSLARGSIGQGQSATALASRELSGTTDDWSRYVEFSADADARCRFALPTG